MRAFTLLLATFLSTSLTAKTPEPTPTTTDETAFFLSMLTSDNAIEQTFGVFLLDVQLESEKTGMDPTTMLQAEEARAESNIDAVIASQEALFSQEQPSCKAIREGLNESLVHIEATGSYFALLAMIVAAETRFCPHEDTLDLTHWTMALDGVQKRVVARMPTYMTQTKAQFEKYSSERYLADAPEWVEKYVIPHTTSTPPEALPSLIEE